MPAPPVSAPPVSVVKAEIPDPAQSEAGVPAVAAPLLREGAQEQSSAAAGADALVEANDPAAGAAGGEPAAMRGSPTRVLAYRQAAGELLRFTVSFDLPAPLVDAGIWVDGHAAPDGHARPSGTVVRGSDIEIDEASLDRPAGQGGPAGVVETLTDPVRIASATFTAGFVWWLTRGGGLLTTMLMGVPAWRHVDLLPVLARGLDDEDEEQDAATAAPDTASDDEVAELFDRGPDGGGRRTAAWNGR